MGQSSKNDLICVGASTYDENGDELTDSLTNVVTHNLEKMGMEVTSWNDTFCTELITHVDTDGCQVIPANVSA